MKKVLNKQNKQTKPDESKQKKTKKIPGSVIFHPSDFRKLNRSGIIKALKLKAKQLKYRNHPLK